MSPPFVTYRHPFVFYARTNVVIEPTYEPYDPTHARAGASALAVSVITSAYAVYFIKYKAALKGQAAAQREVHLVEAQGITLVQTPERERQQAKADRV